MRDRELGPCTIGVVGITLATFMPWFRATSNGKTKDHIFSWDVGLVWSFALPLLGVCGLVLVWRALGRADPLAGPPNRYGTIGAVLIAAAAALMITRTLCGPGEILGRWAVLAPKRTFNVERSWGLFIGSQTALPALISSVQLLLRHRRLYDSASRAGQSHVATS
jgi:hypothetical protein